MNRKRYYFDAGLAVRHGVNGAVFLHAIAFWVAKNRAGGRHFHQGRTWTYNTLASLFKISSDGLNSVGFTK